MGMIVGGTGMYFAMCSLMPFGINSEVNSSTRLNSKIASYSLQVAIKKQYRTKLADKLAKVKSRKERISQAHELFKIYVKNC